MLAHGKKQTTKQNKQNNETNKYKKLAIRVKL